MTGLSDRQQRKLLWFAALLAPALAVQTGRFFADSGLAQVPAAPQATPGSDAAPATIQPPSREPPSRGPPERG